MKIIVTEKNFNEAVIGRKAENLFLMQKSGFNVPEFFCIDADFFDEQSYDTAERILEKELFDYFSENEINEELFSVRSSALCEDSEHHSFAGQYDTFLNVKKENLVKKIIECHSSVKNESVLRYLQENDIKIENLKMAVIIQKMVCADISGVVFSANPQGVLNESVIVVGEGTGNNVVEEKVPVTSYYFNRTDKKYYYEQMNNSLLLDNEIVYKLIEISEQLEKMFGKYVDVEFAIKSGYINILQCRPITTISDETPLIFDNSNIVESYPGITLPLTASFIEEAYYGVFKGAAYRVLKSKRLTMRYEPILHNMIGSANGRIYYKISNWYSVIKFLPFSKKIIPIWQDMMGVTIKEHSEDDNDLNGFRKFITYISAFHEALHVQSNMKALNERFSSVVKMFDSKFPKAESIKALHEIYCKISNMVLKSWDITLLNDMYAFIYTGLLKKKLGDEVKTNKFISEISNIESLKPIKGIVNLSFDAINEDIIEELSELETDEDVRKYLEGKTGEFVNCFKKYIKNYGDRVPEELKLETVTFRVSPILLVKQIVDYATDGHRLCQTNSNLKGKMFFDFNTYNEDEKLSIRFLRSRAELGIKNREASRINRTRIYGMIRSIFIKAGEIFEKQNLIENSRDIFYLTVDEIFEKTDKNSYKDIIKNRKNEYEVYEQLPAFSRIVFNGKEFNKIHSNVNSVALINNDEETFHGTPCSNGITMGEAIVIKDVKNIEDVKDKIIVAKMTDPGWVFMLALSNGIISEKGSLLSHTAIISRELKIPAIVGVKDACDLIQSGDWLKINGKTGTIEMLRRSGDKSNVRDKAYSR